MALYWEHLKGFNGTNTGGTPQNIFSILEWTRATVDPEEGIITSEDMPKLALLTNNPSQGSVFQHSAEGKLTDYLASGISGYSCGSLVATNVKNTFEQENTFEDDTTFNQDSYFNSAIKLGWRVPIKFLDGNHTEHSYIYEEVRANYRLELTGYGGFQFWSNPNQNNNATHLGYWGSNIAPKSLVLGSDSLINSNSIESGYCLYVGDFVKINNYCQAKYFNATSDKRAKENFHKIDDGFLDIVKKVQIYSFTYKSDKKANRTIGLIAQELQDIDIDGFSLVDNKNATGENGDFMMIRESKLIYVLLGAVQELTKEVEDLKKRLGE